MNELLNKFWEGETSLKEEQQLKDYFKSTHIAAAHEQYRDLFNSLEMESSSEVDAFDAFAKVKSQQSQNNSFKRRTWTSIAVAAGVAGMVAVGSGYFMQEPVEDLGTYETPEEAYAATVEALQMVSTRFNQGKNNLQPVTEIEKQTLQVFNLNNL